MRQIAEQARDATLLAGKETKQVGSKARPDVACRGFSEEQTTKTPSFSSPPRTGRGLKVRCQIRNPFIRWVEMENSIKIRDYAVDKLSGSAIRSLTKCFTARWSPGNCWMPR